MNNNLLSPLLYPLQAEQNNVWNASCPFICCNSIEERFWNDSLCSQLDPELQIRALWSASPSAFIQFPDAAGVKNKKVAQSCLINRSPSGTVYSLSSFLGMPENLSRRPREYPLHSPTKYRAPSCRKLSLQSSQELRYLQDAGSQESLWKQTSLLGCTAGVLPSSALKDT